MVMPSPLISVLLGLSPPTSVSPSLSPSITFLDDRLNDSQREAVRFALSTNEVGLIWGPPGKPIRAESLVDVEILNS